MTKIKKDKYFRERGGKAKIIDLSCAVCGQYLFTYQKDGPGWLKRCYLNRVIISGQFLKLFDKKIKDQKEMKNMICQCGTLIGVPMCHKDKRLAYRLERGKFKRKNSKYK
ncbi:hypothetical protein HZB93_03305 [Candidatus Falkowbacteria bacterium]|nr:hypothetical protein [Candidatus Falkowbacteria bacterium]